jgi:hypothetical protein
MGLQSSVFGTQPEVAFHSCKLSGLFGLGSHVARRNHILMTPEVHRYLQNPGQVGKEEEEVVLVAVVEMAEEVVMMELLKEVVAAWCYSHLIADYHRTSWIMKET